jgi:hypothetical protein
MPLTRGLRIVGNLPSLSRPEFGTGFIPNRTIGQTGNRNRIPLRDELSQRDQSSQFSNLKPGTWAKSTVLRVRSVAS